MTTKHFTFDQINPRPGTAERFYAKIARGEADECWPWIAAKDDNGYGRFSFNRRPRLAHRVAFLLVHGRWPTPKCRHTCDHPECCNPAHLVEGTQADNIRDMIERGRYGPHRGVAIAAAIPRGEMHYMAKFTAETILDIRHRRSTKQTSRIQLAAEYKTSKSHITRIVQRKVWKHVP